MSHSTGTIRSMPFSYFDRLSAESKRTYRKSDRIARVELPDVARLLPLAAAIAPALEQTSVTGVREACQALVNELNRQLGTPPVIVKVLERRPANSAYELQGLYEPDEVTGGTARITVWMRTAKKENVVRFRTFLRTLLHEVCHHLDYELYRLAETFHTEGFYARESALMRDLMGESRDGAPPGSPPVSRES